MGNGYTPELAVILKQTLKDIGCVSYQEWKEQKEKAGETIDEELSVDQAIYFGSIRGAVNMIHQLISNNRTIMYSRNLMEERNYIKKWLEKSKEIKDGPVHQISEIEEAIEDRTAEGIKKIAGEMEAGVLKGNKEDKLVEPNKEEKDD